MYKRDECDFTIDEHNRAIMYAKKLCPQLQPNNIILGSTLMNNVSYDKHRTSNNNYYKVKWEERW